MNLIETIFCRKKSPQVTFFLRIKKDGTRIKIATKDGVERKIGRTSPTRMFHVVNLFNRLFSGFGPFTGALSDQKLREVADLTERLIMENGIDPVTIDSVLKNTVERYVAGDLHRKEISSENLQRVLRWTPPVGVV